MSTKKELREEIERLAGQVGRLAEREEARQAELLTPLSAAAGTTGTLVLAGGQIVPVAISDVQMQREQFGPFDISMIIHPQIDGVTK